MTNEEKLDILNNMLKKYGLSLEDENVKDFFYKNRKLQPLNWEEQNNFSYSGYIKPTVLSILPSDIENATYAETHNLHTLMDWYLYKNSGDNPLVFNNLEKDHKSIKESYETRAAQVKIGIDGKMFNSGDGNHRLLTLIIKHFAERTAAKTEAERQAVDDAYRMNVKVNYPVSVELADLLDDEDRKTFFDFNNIDIYPAFSYRRNAFGMAEEKMYLAEYDPETKTYKYELNGVAYAGDEKGLVEFLKQQEKGKSYFMSYKCGDTYYVSCYNRVYQTKDKQRAIEIAHRVKEEYDLGNSPKEKFLIIQDMDKGNNQEYSVQFWGVWLDGKQSGCKEVAEKLLNLLNTFDLDTINQCGLEKIREECDFAMQFYTLAVDKIQLNNLSEQEFLKVYEIFTKISNVLYLKDNEKTIEM